MVTINIQNLVGDIIVVTTPESLEKDVEAKITTTVVNALEKLKAQFADSPSEHSQHEAAVVNCKFFNQNLQVLFENTLSEMLQRMKANAIML